MDMYVCVYVYTMQFNSLYIWLNITNRIIQNHSHRTHTMHSLFAYEWQTHRLQCKPTMLT